MRTDHPGKAENVIVMDTVEARDTLDEYLKQHPEQRGKPKIGVSPDYRPEHWPKPRVRFPSLLVGLVIKQTAPRFCL